MGALPDVVSINNSAISLNWIRHFYLKRLYLIQDCENRRNFGPFRSFKDLPRLGMGCSGLPFATWPDFSQCGTNCPAHWLLQGYRWNRPRLINDKRFGTALAQFQRSAPVSVYRFHCERIAAILTRRIVRCREGSQGAVDVYPVSAAGFHRERPS